MFGILAMNMGDEDAVVVLDFIVKTIVKVCYPPFTTLHWPPDSWYSW